MPIVTTNRTYCYALTLPQDAEKVTGVSVAVPCGGLLGMTGWLDGQECTGASLSGAGPHTVTVDLNDGQVIQVETSGSMAITFDFDNVVPGKRIAIVLVHLHTGNIVITWGGAPVVHRFLDDASVDGQPRRGSGRTVWVGHVYDDAGTMVIRWTSERANVVPGSLRHRHVEDTTSTLMVDAAGHFVMSKSGTINQSIASPGGADFQVWVTPSRPFAITSASIEITDDASADGDVNQIVYSLTINGGKLVEQTDSGWGPGTSYVVGGANTSLFTVRGDLLDGTNAPDGSGTTGAGFNVGEMTVFRDGGGSGYWGQQVALHVEPTTSPPAATRTYTIPWKVRLEGYFL